MIKPGRCPAHRILLLIGFCLLASCQSDLANERTTVQEDQPARIAELTAAQRTELNAAIQEIYPQSKIQLGNNAFSSSHILVLASKQAKTPLGTLATGRQARPTNIFHLVHNSGSCVLIHIASGRRFPLSFTCQPHFD